MLKSRVRCQNRVVWFYNRVRGLRGRVDGELELRFFAIISREAFKEQCAETRACSTTERMEDKEALETRAVVRQTANFVHDNVYLLLANRVMPAGV